MASGEDETRGRGEQEHNSYGRSGSNELYVIDLGYVGLSLAFHLGGGGVRAGEFSSWGVGWC